MVEAVLYAAAWLAFYAYIGGIAMLAINSLMSSHIAQPSEQRRSGRS